MDPSSAAPAPMLEVRTVVHGGHAVLAPQGEIDYGSVFVLDRALAGLPDDVCSVVVNMAEVTFMDSAGLHFLDRLRAMGRRRGIPVRAGHLGRQPRRILEVDDQCSAVAPEDSVGTAEPAPGRRTVDTHVQGPSYPVLRLLPPLTET